MFNAPFPPFHPPFRHSRFFQRGDMKYVILDILKNKPAHGYEVIQILEDRFHGFYSPNAGSVYPVLQLLEDLGYVTVTAADGKKIYTITEAGKIFLKEQHDATEKIKGRMHGFWRMDREYIDDIRTAIEHVHDIRDFIGHVAMRKDPSKISKINEILNKAAGEIKQIYKDIA